jgi:hypothetical protein
MDTTRFDSAVKHIDAANGSDPNVLLVGGVARPKELVHAEMLTRWLGELLPGASEAVLLAARAHHIRRWEHPRSELPDGRTGYLRWRTQLRDFHADLAAKILRGAGYDAESIERVRTLIRKRAPASDPEAQALEDGLCLVFMETQFQSLNDRIADEKMVDVLRKTWAKMSPAGRTFALALNLPPHHRDLVERALAAG